MFGLTDFSGCLDNWFLDLDDLVVFRIRIRMFGFGSFWIFRIPGSIGFQDLDDLVVFRDKDSNVGFGLVWIFRIWIRWSGFGFGFFRQDIGVDRDTKMVKCSALPSVFRAPVVFLRRLVLLTGFLDLVFFLGFG